MTAPHIIDPAGLLGEALSQASPDLMRSLLQHVINALLSADADTVCGAQWGQQDPQRHTQRNGYRYRPLDTRVGTIDVAIPKLRSGTYFPEWLLQRRKRSENALITVVADCYLAGVSDAPYRTSSSKPWGSQDCPSPRSHAWQPTWTSTWISSATVPSTMPGLSPSLPLTRSP